MAEMDWGNLIRLLGAVGGLGGGLMQSFRKEPLPYGVQEAAQSANNANTYMAASADPNSPYFRNIAGAEEARSRTDLISSVDRIMREIASRGAGGRGTINPERRDETIWGILARGFQDAGMKARETARQQLLNMAGGAQRNASAYSSLTQPSMLMQMFNRQNQNSGLSGATTGVERLGSFITGQKKPPAPGYSPEQWGTVKFGMDSLPNEYKDYYNAPGL